MKLAIHKVFKPKIVKKFTLSSVVTKVDPHSSLPEPNVLLLDCSDLGVKVEFAERGRKTGGPAEKPWASG